MQRSQQPKLTSNKLQNGTAVILQKTAAAAGTWCKIGVRFETSWRPYPKPLIYFHT